MGVPPLKDTSNPSGLIVVKLDRLRLGIFGWWFHQNTLGISHGDFYSICAARQVHVAIKWKRTMYTVHHKSVEVGLVRVPIKAGGISSWQDYKPII